MTRPDIHTADIPYRRRIIALIALCLALGLPLIGCLGSWLGDVATQLRHADTASQRQGLRVLLAGLGIAIGISAAVASRAVAQRVREIRASDSLPPPHWRTLRDVRIIRGAAAREWATWLARIQHAAAAIAVASFIAAAWACWHYR